MSDDVIVFTAGLRIGGKYSEFIQSNREPDVDEYIEIMKKTKPEDSVITKMIKTYRCISTTPYVIND